MTIPVLDQSQVSALRAHIHPHYRHLLEFLLHSAARTMETVELRWRDIET